MTETSVIGLIILGLALWFASLKRSFLITILGVSGVIIAGWPVVNALKKDLRESREAEAKLSQSVLENGRTQTTSQGSLGQLVGGDSSVLQAPSPIPVPAPLEYPADSAQYVQTSSVLRLSVRSCRRGDRITCRFTITNTSSDRDITVDRGQMRVLTNYNTRIIDEAGNEFELTKIRLARKEGYSQIRVHAVEGVSMELELTFERGASESKEIKLMEIIGTDHGIDDHLDFRFRNLLLHP